MAKDRDLRAAASGLLAACSDLIAAYGQDADVIQPRRWYDQMASLRVASVAVREALKEPRPAKVGKR